MSTRDAETAAMEAIHIALKELNTSQRHRVLRWAVERYLPTKKMLALTHTEPTEEAGQR